jgi:hypothetical protein
VVSLGHNLIVHDPAGAGLTYLKALHDAGDLKDKRVRPALVLETLAAGEPGEAMAVAALASDDKDRRAFWASYLQSNALYASSVEPLHKRIAVEPDPSIKKSLTWALSVIGSPKSLPVVQDLAKTTTDDEVQAAALFACVELAGFDAIPFIEAIKPLGEMAAAE